MREAQVDNQFVETYGLQLGRWNLTQENVGGKLIVFNSMKGVLDYDQRDFLYGCGILEEDE